MPTTIAAGGVTPPPTIAEFFNVMFGANAPSGGIHTASFPFMTDCQWYGRRRTDRNRGTQDDLRHNNFWCIALMDPATTGRTDASILGHRLLVADDVGTKANAVTLEALLGTPTFKIETSPGNQTWGWVIAGGVDPKDEDRMQLLNAIRDHMKRNGLTDPGTADGVRYIRQPYGSNTKPAYQNPQDGSFPETILVEWNPKVVVDLELAGQALLGPDFWTVARSGRFMPMSHVGDGSGTSSFSDPWVRLAQEIGLDPRQGAGAGKIDANCPNMGAHSQRPESGFAFLGGGALKCHHGECAHLTVGDMQGLMFAEYERQVADRAARGLVADAGGGKLADVFSGEPVPASGQGFVARATFAEHDEQEAVRLGVGVGEVRERIERAAQDASARTQNVVAQKDAQLAADLADLSEQFCLVQTISGVVVRQPSGGGLYGVMNTQYFQTFFNGRKKIPTGRGNQTVGLGSYWLDDGQTPRYTSVGLWPVGQEPKGALNLFTGLPDHSDRPTWRPLISGQTGKIDKLLDFLKTVIADGDAGGYEYILDWLAFLVQRPLDKPGVNLVLIGEEGTGKGTIFRMMLDVFGEKYSLHVTQGEHLLGRFSGHLEGVLFAFVDEALFGRDKRTVGQYKALTTEPTMLVEHKGQTPRRVRNHLKFGVASNEASAVPAGVNDRRASVFEVSVSKRSNKGYFDALWHEWDRRGGRQAFIAFLLARDISTFDHHKPYATAAKYKVAQATADPITNYWLDTLANGNVPGGAMLPANGVAAPDWDRGSVVVLNRDLAQDFALWARNNRVNHPPSRAEVVARVRQLCPKARASRNRVNGNIEHNTEFPMLGICRAEAEKSLGGGIFENLDPPENSPENPPEFIMPW